jgi:hypothetical protein
MKKTTLILAISSMTFSCGVLAKDYQAEVDQIEKEVVQLEASYNETNQKYLADRDETEKRLKSLGMELTKPAEVKEINDSDKALDDTDFSSTEIKTDNTDEQKVELDEEQTLNQK